MDKWVSEWHDDISKCYRVSFHVTISLGKIEVKVQLDVSNNTKEASMDYFYCGPLKSYC